MLRGTKDMIDYSLGASDGDIGTVRDFFFDDQDWIIRYLVADTGSWLSDQLVLISPSALGTADWNTRTLSVDLTREQVRNSPPLEAHQPVSRQKEIELSQYYGWPMYWNPSMVAAGGGVMVGPAMAGAGDISPKEQEKRKRQSQGDPHLRSVREVIGYHVAATDGEIGHVEDFVIDDGSWRVQYVVVDTRNWWPARKVVMLPMWVSDVDWDLREVRFELTMDAIREGPEYNPSAPVNERDEVRFYDYYGRPKSP